MTTQHVAPADADAVVATTTHIPARDIRAGDRLVLWTRGGGLVIRTITKVTTTDHAVEYWHTDGPWQTDPDHPLKVLRD